MSLAGQPHVHAAGGERVPRGTVAERNPLAPPCRCADDELRTQQPGVDVLPDGPPPFLSRYDWTPDTHGEAVTFSRSDLPSIVRREAFDITVSFADIEEVYLELRKLQLGADSRGSL